MTPEGLGMNRLPTPVDRRPGIEGRSAYAAVTEGERQDSVELGLFGPSGHLALPDSFLRLGSSALS